MGITPAYAGKNLRRCNCTHPAGDHPPHVRGKAGLSHGCLVLVGITPACAGKSFVCCPRLLFDWDHPRVCGEKLFQSPLLRLPLGSPPVCGEKSKFYKMAMENQGSPPPVRGKEGLFGRQAPPPRITPACAGKSCPPPAPTFTRRDHPRVCGEKCPPGKFFFMTVGSPPRVRGKDNQRGDSSNDLRITPAYAGKRCSARTPTFRTWDHPRVCGEKTEEQKERAEYLGSPPRMRGKVPSSI